MTLLIHMHDPAAVNLARCILARPFAASPDQAHSMEAAIADSYTQHEREAGHMPGRLKLGRG